LLLLIPPFLSFFFFSFQWRIKKEKERKAEANMKLSVLIGLVVFALVLFGDQARASGEANLTMFNIEGCG